VVALAPGLGWFAGRGGRQESVLSAAD
jgi:hypothetical protein